MFVHGIFILFSLIINGLCVQAASLVNRWKVNKVTASPAANCWASIAQIGDDSAVHIAGTTGFEQGELHSSFHLYNATTRSYEKYNVSLQIARFAPTVVTMGGKIYIIGGVMYENPAPWQFDYHILDDMYEFDPIESTLEQVTVVGDAPIPMVYGSAAQIDDDQFVLFSGEGPFYQVTSKEIWSFNVKSKQWTSQMEMPVEKMRSNAAVTLYDHFGVGKHGVFLLGGSIGDPDPWTRNTVYDNRAWILNPETWALKVLPTDGSSGVLPEGEFHKLTTEKIPEGTRVWAFGSNLLKEFISRKSNSLQFIDIPKGTVDSGPTIYWQSVPVVNQVIRNGYGASYMLHRRDGLKAEPHILGFCFESSSFGFFENETYLISRNDPGPNGAHSLLYDDTNYAKDGEIISIRAGDEVEFRVAAYDADREPINYGKVPVTSFLTHTATQQRIFAKVNDLENGSYNFSYTPKVAGTWTLEVFLNGDLVNNRTNLELPVNLNIIPSTPVAHHTVILGDGVTNPTAGTWSKFTVQVRDMYNNTVLREAAELANVSVTVIPNFNMPDGTSSPLNFTSEITDAGIEFTYRANYTGSYKISTFMGDQIIQSGIDINVVRDPIVNVDPPATMTYNLDSPEVLATGVLLFFSAVGIILCIGCMIGIIIYRNENIIKAIDVRASLICLSGLLLLFISGLFWISGEPTSMTCNMWPFFVSTGLGIVFSTLSAKIWHVYKIFTTKNMQKVSKWNSIFVQGFIVFIDIIICVTWTVVDPPIPMVKYPDTYFSHRDCSSSSTAWQKVFVTLIVSFNGFLVFGGLAVAYLSKDLPSRYNQAAHIGISMQSFMILAMFGLPILGFMDKNLIEKIYVRFLIIWVPAMVTTVLLFGLRVYIAYRTRRLQKLKGQTISTVKSVDSNTSSFVKYIATTSDTEIPGKTMRMNHFTVFWCQEHFLLPNIWLKSTMIVVPSIGLLAFTDHEYGDAHMMIDSRNAKLERIPPTSDFQYMLRLRTQNNGAYLIGAFSSSDLAMFEPLIKTLIANNLDCLHVLEKPEMA